MKADPCDAYIAGFLCKCAEAGVDPSGLAKEAGFLQAFTKFVGSPFGQRIMPFVTRLGGEATKPGVKNMLSNVAGMLRVPSFIGAGFGVGVLGDHFLRRTKSMAPEVERIAGSV